MSEKSESSVFSMRLPDEYRKILEMQAHRKGWSLGQQIQRIIQVYLMEQGYGQYGMTSLKSGRLFEIVPHGFEDNIAYTVHSFFVIEPKYEQERAMYIFGLDRRVLRDWRTLNRDRELVTKQVGIALLNFYNRAGYEIDQLSWNQPLGQLDRMRGADDRDDTRILLPAEVPESFDAFINCLKQNDWSDQFLHQAPQSQDIRAGNHPSQFMRNKDG